MNVDVICNVQLRAGDRCEYCRVPQAFRSARLQVDHVIARQHGGHDDPSNLALACVRCNLRKGPNLTGIDRTTGIVTRLFDPRTQQWPDHFELNRGAILGRTDVGRTTVVTLDLNAPEELAIRALLQELRHLP